MSDELAAILDDINLHIEREIAKVPTPVAEALLRDDRPISTVELLRILAQPDQADVLHENESEASESADAANDAERGLSSA